MSKRTLYSILGVAACLSALLAFTVPAAAKLEIVWVLIDGAPVPVEVDTSKPLAEQVPGPIVPPPAPEAPADPAAPASPLPEPGFEDPFGAPTANPSDREKRADDEKAEKDSKSKDADKSEAKVEGDRKNSVAEKKEASKLRNADGSPTSNNPGLFDALPGPSTATGVPNFVIRKFKVPVFLLPIYQAAGIQYGIRWELLAAINEIETDYGRNLNVSSAGALGWMQFMPATWKSYGVDGNKDGEKDPYNPVDAIFAAARYLKAAGYEQDVRRAVFAYNHADWYVDSVLMRARLIAGMPSDLVGSLTGLTEGRFPVYARARYADDLSEREATKRVSRGENAANVIEGDVDRRGIEIYSRKGAPVVAANDGVIKRIGVSKRLGKFVVLQDVYGNRYIYAGLGSVSRLYPVPKQDAGDLKTEAKALKARDGTGDPAPTVSASAGRQPDEDGSGASGASDQGDQGGATVTLKQRMFARPMRPASKGAGGLEQVMNSDAGLRGYTVFQGRFSRAFGVDAEDVRLKRLKRGSRVVGGTILGRVGRPEPAKASHLYFEIRPAGRGAPRIDPKPILDGWKLLESTAIYRASGRNVLYGDQTASIGQVLLLPKPLLERRVLSDSRIELYECGRRDVRSGQIDRRVLATLAFLAESGLRPTVTSLKCGHGFYTSSGNVSHHSSGNAVDIAKINGVSILGHQEPGGITETTVKRLMNLQGTLQADQIISLLEMGGPTYAMADHNDHIHVGFRPLFGDNRKLGRQTLAVLKPGQWHALVDRLGKIENPTVRQKTSKYAIPAKKSSRSERASRAHSGE